MVDPAAAKLADAQLVLARSYRAPSWTRLVQAVQLADAIWRDDPDTVGELVTRNPALIKEHVPIRTDSNWGPPMTYAANLGRDRILEHLIRTTPQDYRVNDARFLIGEIWWQQGRLTEALEIWRRINPDASDEYFMVYSYVRTNTGADTQSRTRINAALNEQTRRWTQASFERLRHFGFRFDTF